MPNDRTTPDLAADNAVFGKQGVGTRDGSDRYSKLIGEITMWRQAGSGGDLARPDPVPKRIRQAAVERLGSARDIDGLN